jgi:hypothetical protein
MPSHLRTFHTAKRELGRSGPLGGSAQGHGISRTCVTRWDPSLQRGLASKGARYSA